MCNEDGEKRRGMGIGVCKKGGKEERGRARRYLQKGEERRGGGREGKEKGSDSRGNGNRERDKKDCKKGEENGRGRKGELFKEGGGEGKTSVRNGRKGK